MAEPDTERPLLGEPCQQWQCPFEGALVRLKQQDERRIRSEQSIIENLDRLADALQRIQRDHHDGERDLLELRREVAGNAADVLSLRASLTDVHALQKVTHRRVTSVKYWLAAIVAAVALASPLVEGLLKVLRLK